MNEPHSKKIIFNKSTLLSLKAELLKKQEEVKEKKQLPQHKIENYKPKSISSEQKPIESDDKNKKNLKDRLVAIDTDELESCRKSKLMLEKKAELYNHLADSTGESQLASNFLVDFKQKKQLSDPQPDTTQSQEPCNNISVNDDDQDWTEFSDCLGRTRVCLKSELEFYKKRDQQLMKLMKKDDPEDQTEEPKPEKPFLVQKTNDYLQSLREKWEEKEKELLAKDKDIHYQDLLFDEARMHGVGYYSFSTNETERRKQMTELMKERKETLRAQKEAEELRKKRDELVAARVAAARARQRARAGLPPEEPTEKQKDFTTCLLEFLTEQKNEADNRAKDEDKKIKEAQEKERQKLREAYVREWDIGKEGVDEKLNKFKEMTQEEYVEQQRSKRIKEFAPLNASHHSNNKGNTKNNTFDSTGKVVQNDEEVSKSLKTWTDVRPLAENPSTPVISDLPDPEKQKGLYFFSKKPEQVVKYRNYTQQLISTPIVNELSEDENNETEHRKCEKRKSMANHTEIAPPPTYEYYGPVPKQVKSQIPFHSDLREAYAQGAKSLEPKTGERQLSKNYDFTFD